MKTFKMNFTDTENKSNFVTIDAINEGEAIDLFLQDGVNPECMLSLVDVTGKFVDVDGTIK